MATQEQVKQNFQAAIERLKPAVLKNTYEDRVFIERLVTQHMLANQLQPTADNFYAVFKHHMKTLPWAVKPAALVREEENLKPRATLDVLAETEDFIKKQQAGEQREADKKEVEKLVLQSESLIAGYLPVRHTPRGTVIDERERTDSQATWRATLVKASKQGVVAMRTYTKSLADVIAKRYSDRERASERV